MASLQDTVHVQGLAALGAKLERLPDEIKEKVARRAMAAAARVGLNAVQAEAPVRTGNLRRNIRMAYHTRGVEPGVVQYIVFVKTGGKPQRSGSIIRGFRGDSKPSYPSGIQYPWYWIFVEFGTSKMAANPFMLRGFASSAETAANAARDAAANELHKVATT